MHSVLNCPSFSKYVCFLPELDGFLHHRGEAIAGRVADSRRGGTAEIADYMMLQMIHRYEPVVNHLAQITGLHPLGLYQQLLQMAGELSTFVSKEKRPPQFPTYLHDDLQKPFSPVISTLRTYLSMVYEQTAIGLSLVEKK